MQFLEIIYFNIFIKDKISLSRKLHSEYYLSWFSLFEIFSLKFLKFLKFQQIRTSLVSINIHRYLKKVQFFIPELPALVIVIVRKQLTNFVY